MIAATQSVTNTELKGSLTLSSMSQFLDRIDALASAQRIDLSNVQNADSAGLSLLLELQRRARQQGHSISFEGAGPQLCALADFLGVSKALKLTNK